MEITESKAVLAYIISESSLKESDKINLIAYIEKLDPEIAEGLINIDEIGPIGGLGKIIGVGLLITTAYSLGRLAYNRYLTQAARACKDKEGIDRSACIDLYKERGLKARLAALRKESTKCNQTDNVAKCRKTFAEAIRKVEDAIRRIR